MPIATFALLAIMRHAAIGASSEDGGTTSHAISVDADGDDAATIPDFDGDGTIGFGDLLKFAEKFGLDQGDDGYDAQYDLNDDDEIGFSDFVLFAQNFGKKAPAFTGGVSPGGEAGRREWKGVIFHSFKVSDTSLTAGQAFTLEMTLQNRTTGLYVDLRYFLSLDETIDASDAFIHSDWRSVDMETTAIPVSLDWTAPSYAGTYYYGVCEFWGLELSGCSSGVRVNVEGNEDGAPDLVVFSPHISHTSVTPGSRKTARIRTQNLGTGPAAATSLRYLLSVDATFDVTDTPFQTYDIGSIAVETFGYAWLLPSIPSNPGTHHFTACVDPVPGESDTHNNCSQTMPVNVGVPDLAVSLAWASTSAAVAEKSFELTATVRNQGPEAAGSTTLRYYRSDDATIDATDARQSASTRSPA